MEVASKWDHLAPHFAPCNNTGKRKKESAFFLKEKRPSLWRKIKS